ncbi:MULTISPECIES: reductive dehalogenase [Dehalobacter]|uniref:Reductive dehalogenase n=5 Tax=Bacteria TaxID=2 RepID=A0A857DHD4_9FIRM|nr:MULTISPECIES: reductive dehalogenase [Dehalobacter]MCG1025870.1 reductive dehalogenase [Dehalobacter sp.]QGZ99918.1 reductive dehalogenase [Dehalobacter restrictus]
MSNEQKQQLKINRRNFLKAGAAATAMGVVGALTAPAKVASAAGETFRYTAAPKGQWSKLHPVHDMGSVSLRFVEQNDQWLGTTKIVGPIKRTSQYDSGFDRCAEGKVSQRGQLGLYNLIPKDPMAMAIVMGTALPRPLVEGPVAPVKTEIPDPEQMSMHIKDLAYFLRADDVGIGKMPSYAYYSEKVIYEPFPGRELFELPREQCVKPMTEPDMPYVIVVMVDQNLKTTLASTGYDAISLSQSFLGYHSTGVISVIIAQYIRNLGYNARAQYAVDYNANMPPVIIAAGLGELSRTGECTIHPRLGFRHKVAAITTDLPLTPDKPVDFGLLDFCRICKKCADNCPSGAISLDDDMKEINGYLRWATNADKCAEFRASNEEGASCGRCMKVCPWNSKEDSWFHQAGTWFGSQTKTSASMLKSIDDMFGYGTEQIEKYKWWLEWPENYKLPPVSVLTAPLPSHGVL